MTSKLAPTDRGHMNLFEALDAKRCSRCKIDKPRDQFNNDKKRKDGKHPYCAECVRADGRRYREARVAKGLPSTTAAQQRWRRENVEYGRAYSRRQRQNPEFAAALKAKKREYYQANKAEFTAKMRDYQFKRKFGISLTERDELAARHEHQCAICGDAEVDASRRHAVDHDHSTGDIRGLLCQPCNQGLGHFRDRIDLLEAAASYLRTHAQEVLHGEQGTFERSG